MQPKYAMVHEYGSHSEPMLFPYLDPNYYTSQYLFDKLVLVKHFVEISANACMNESHDTTVHETRTVNRVCSIV